MVFCETFNKVFPIETNFVNQNGFFYFFLENTHKLSNLFDIFWKIETKFLKFWGYKRQNWIKIRWALSKFEFLKKLKISTFFSSSLQHLEVLGLKKNMLDFQVLNPVSLPKLFMRSPPPPRQFFLWGGFKPIFSYPTKILGGVWISRKEKFEEISDPPPPKKKKKKRKNNCGGGLKFWV